MTECEYCMAASNPNKIYEDKKVIAFLPSKPAALGHIILISKKHYQIFEQLPDYEAAYILNIANKLSTAIFEAIGAKGTNVLIQNGTEAGQIIPHFSVHIIPREEKDKIDFQWQARQLTEEEMSTVELRMKQSAELIGDFELEEEKKPIELEKKPEKIEAGKGENYLIKQLERIP